MIGSYAEAASQSATGLVVEDDNKTGLDHVEVKGESDVAADEDIVRKYVEMIRRGM